MEFINIKEILESDLTIENETTSETTDILEVDYDTLIAQVQITNDILMHQYACSLFTVGVSVACLVVLLLYKFMKLFY